MRIGTEILSRPIAAVLEGYPYAGDFFLAAGIGGLSPRPETVQAFLDGLDEGLLEDVGSTPAELGRNFVAFLNRMEGLKRQSGTVSEITILGGQDKLGRPEDLRITIRRGEVITVLGPTVANLMTGSFVIEKIFAIPGLGGYLVNSVSQRDYTTIMGVTIFYATFLMVMIFVVDIFYCLIDPRIKYE